MATLLCMITDFQNAPAEQNLIGYHPWNGFSVLLHVLLPLGGFVLLFGGRSFLSKVLLQFDRNCIAVCCPSLSKREKLLKWASARLPPTWSSQGRTLSNGISELWKDGSLLCVLINTVVPEACPNPHRHWKKAPIHAQTLAYKYLGVIPVFTQNELLCEFSISEEKRFIHYLYKLQDAINNFPEIENKKFSSEHVARGMGLYTGEKYRIATFFIYSSLTTHRDCVLILYIKGPFKTEGKASFSTSHSLKVLPVTKVLEDHFEATKSLPLKSDERRSFLKNISLKFESLMAKNEERIEDDKIPIQVEFEQERIKISYIPNNTGIYEIHLFSEGKAFRGSPFRVNVDGNTSGDKDTFHESQIKEKVSVTKRKILSKVIDCIDEKIHIDDVDEDYKSDMTITAVTQRKNEMLKTEINCALENISEENITSDGKNSTGNIDKATLDEIVNVTQDLNSDLIENEFVAVNTQRKIVRDCDQAKEEIVKILQDSSNRNELIKDETDALKRVKSEIFLEIAPKNAKKATFYRSVTSPICPNHIVPEVEVETPLNHLSLAEKRKIFTKQESFDCGNVNETQNSSKILSVLDVLNDIKQCNSGNLVTTKSLPNISAIGNDELDENKSFKERKEYWERLSSISSSNDSLSTFECINVSKTSKRSWKTSGSDRVTSVDSSLEDCSVIPLEERRKQLLQQFENTFFLPQISPSKISKNNGKKPPVKTPKHKNTEETVTSQFKRAVNYFKSLEDNSRQNEIFLTRRRSTNSETKELPEFIRSFFH